MAIVPIRFGVRYNPASFALEYRDDATGTVELVEMSVNVEAGASPEALLEKLRKRHDRFLRDDVVSLAQCKRLLQMLIDNGMATSPMAAAARPESTRSASSALTLETENSQAEPLSPMNDDPPPARTFREAPDDGLPTPTKVNTNIKPPAPPATSFDATAEEDEDEYAEDVEDFEEEVLEEEDDDKPLAAAADEEDDNEAEPSPAPSPVSKPPPRTEIVRDFVKPPSPISKPDEGIPTGATLLVESDSESDEEPVRVASPAAADKAEASSPVQSEESEIEADSDFEFDGVENIDSDGSEGYTFD